MKSISKYLQELGWDQEVPLHPYNQFKQNVKNSADAANQSFRTGSWMDKFGKPGKVVKWGGDRIGGNVHDVINTPSEIKQASARWPTEKSVPSSDKFSKNLSALGKSTKDTSDKAGYYGSREFFEKNKDRSNELIDDLNSDAYTNPKTASKMISKARGLNSDLKKYVDNRNTSDKIKTNVKGYFSDLPATFGRQVKRDVERVGSTIRSANPLALLASATIIGASIYLYKKWKERAKQVAQKAPSGQKRKTYQAVKKAGAVQALRKLDQDKNKIKSQKDQRAHDTVKKGLIKIIKGK